MSDPRDDSGLRAAVLIGYGLFILALTNGLTAIAGIILAYLKRDEARGTPWQGHFRNLIVVFWVSAILFALAVAIILPGALTVLWSLFETNGNPPPALLGGLAVALPALWLAGLVFLIWYLYRIVGGFIRAIDGRPY
jgi:uncharacterized membrane protein